MHESSLKMLRCLVTLEGEEKEWEFELKYAPELTWWFAPKLPVVPPTRT
jgi:hypothetical protein